VISARLALARWLRSLRRPRWQIPPDADRSTAAILRRVAPYTRTSPERVLAVVEAVRYLVRAGIEGDVVECGVWRGGSAMAAALALREQGDHTRLLHLFDTFEGMTEPDESDVSFRGERASELLLRSRRETDGGVWCYAPLEEVQAGFDALGIERARLRFVPGRVEDTLPNRAPARIALLRLDTDWYESTRHELVHLFPRLVSGGILIVDDYGHWLGARRAVDEYLNGLGEPFFLARIDYTGRIGVRAAPGGTHRSP
jgi:O-methyltransferase